MITITDRAAEKIIDIIVYENDPNTKLRIYVQGGGCSGFQYGFQLDTVVNEDDHVIEKNGISIVTDSISMQYLLGSTVDYQEELMSTRFVINNPNASAHCGCGSSFSV